VSVMRWDPFGDPFRGLDRLTSQLLSGTRTPLAMPMDVWQAADGTYHVTLDLPGVDPSDVEITSERNVISIRAERRPDYGEDDNVLVAERPMGQYTRQLQVGDALDTGNVSADYRNGVLHMSIPVSEAAQPRRIEVRAGSDEQVLTTGGTQPAGTSQTSEGGQPVGAGQASGGQTTGEAG
jgi:HSP20 family protein